MMKTTQRLSVIAVLLTIFVFAACFTGCGNVEKENPAAATADEASVSATVAQDSTEEATVTSSADTKDEDTTSATEGNDTTPAETDTDGSETYPTEKSAGKADTSPTEGNTGKSGSSADNTSSSKSTNSSASANPGSGKSGTSSSKPSSQSNSSSSGSGSSSASSDSANSGSGSSSSRTPNSGSSTTSSKTWHEAEYEYIDHPAETTDVWVVDQEAYSYEKPIYEYPHRTICNQCGADITGNIDAHFKANEDTCWSYRVKAVKTQVGTKTVDVPEKGHWETKITKEAWTEKKLVREAGYY